MPKRKNSGEREQQPTVNVEEQSGKKKRRQQGPRRPPNTLPEALDRYGRPCDPKAEGAKSYSGYMNMRKINPVDGKECENQDDENGVPYYTLIDHQLVNEITGQPDPKGIRANTFRKRKSRALQKAKHEGLYVDPAESADSEVNLPAPADAAHAATAFAAATSTDVTEAVNSNFLLLSLQEQLLLKQQYINALVQQAFAITQQAFEISVGWTPLEQQIILASAQQQAAALLQQAFALSQSAQEFESSPGQEHQELVSASGSGEGEEEMSQLWGALPNNINNPFGDANVSFPEESPYLSSVPLSTLDGFSDADLLEQDHKDEEKDTPVAVEDHRLSDLSSLNEVDQIETKEEEDPYQSLFQNSMVLFNPPSIELPKIQPDVLLPSISPIEDSSLYGFNLLGDG